MVRKHQSVLFTTLLLNEMHADYTTTKEMRTAHDESVLRLKHL